MSKFKFVHLVMIHIKYQGSRPSGFKQEYFYVFNLEVNVNSVTFKMTPFWTHYHNLNKLGRIPMGDVTYQISKLWGNLFSGKNISLYNLLTEQNS